MMAFALFHGCAQRASSSSQQLNAAVTKYLLQNTQSHQLTVELVPRSYALLVYLCIALFDGAWTDNSAPTVPSLAANGLCMQ